MNYTDLRSIIGSKKTRFNLAAPTKSFYIVSGSDRAYIEPTFTKQDFSQEKPRFLLITAVGASGKTALAHKLSADTGLPILDLGVHPPVADNTLTGLLTTSFPLEVLSNLLTSLKSGTFGVIIDGIDEGRSKVNELAFNAFLDDLIKLSAGSSRTCFVLLGRTQALIDCWIYLQEKVASVGFAAIDPFSHNQAVTYINTFAEPPDVGQRAQYDAARDLILSRLATAFSNQTPKYLSFLGYPPVLDAIATLLREEKNYFLLSEQLGDSGLNELEANLLYKIASYILERERSQKILPNVVEGMLGEFPPEEQARIRYTAFSFEEQSTRLVAYVLRQPCELQVIPQPGLNAKYEEQLASFLSEHPFLIAGGRDFRNAVFEAVCLAILIAGRNPDHIPLVTSYAAQHRSNLYLLQMLKQIAPGCRVDNELLHVLIASALEFRSLESNAEITVEPCVPLDQELEELDGNLNVDVDIAIEVVAATSDEEVSKFTFRTDIKASDRVLLGPRLSACYLDVPCDVLLAGADEIELTAPVEILARRIDIRARALVVKSQPKSTEKSVLLDATEISAAITTLPVETGTQFVATVRSKTDYHYPLVKYIKKRELLPSTGGLSARYLKLRKILTHFRSHSRGSMAKLRAKVENERVAGNEIGRPVLDRLLHDGILTADGTFYFLQPAYVHKFLGVTWTQLREGEVSQKLIEYLLSIK